ncbi:MAG: DUF4168 domain-containing protein [Leptolyngbyaceae bacterium]|nr:DUF4168 domain-containing protein [Leptolyngbyaceae bacterium]
MISLWFLSWNPSPAIAEELTTASEGAAISPEQSIPSYTSLDSSNISDEKVSQFVNAYLQVVDLVERREGELQGSETDSESFQIEREIETAAFAIIEKAGLTRQEYLQLLSLANTEPEFGERIADQLQEGY